MILSQDILQYIHDHVEEATDLLIRLAQIPAPSNHEEARAEFCRDWLTAQGCQGVYIDEALNVIYPIGCDENTSLVVFMAHSDVVFPDTTPLPLSVSDGKIHCPGVGDDTANVMVLMMAAKYLARQGCMPKDTGVLLVINSGEEGLGNLKGCRKIMKDFGNRITEFVSFDGSISSVVNKAVGSRRFQICVDTEGGHSYSKFGNRNAIAYLSALINDLYSIKVPELGKTTYNVGLINGGTSVNTIAQHAEMLYEFRSDERDALDFMQRHLDTALDFYRAKGVSVTCTPVGDRPCSGMVDEAKHNALMERTAAAIRQHYGIEPVFRGGSTDCNIPLSMSIPAVALSCVDGSGAHTREEYVLTDSIEPGLAVGFSLILDHFV